MAGLVDKKLILSLCDYSGNWPKFYAEDPAYEVICIDLKRGGDIRMIEFLDKPVYGILAAPPCTAFAGSGAQYWPKKDKNGETLEGISIIDACLRMVAIYKPTFWALENPVGRLRRWIGPPRLSFNPCDYGDPYTKKTLLWGEFNAPIKNPVDPVMYERGGKKGSWMWAKLGGRSEKTKELRSMTPLGFAKAFYEANK